jgi:S-adenosyl-L-methionine hydrolase (adenosine-forming)
VTGAEHSPVITLLTDFGTKDIYAGVMRGVITNLAPHARIVDLTHDVPPQGVADAAFLLDAAAPYFPWGTIHVAVVDPSVGTERRIICVRTSRATYLAPDNGLLTRVLDRESAARIVSVENRSYFLPEVSNTFHGRDIFAPVAAHLALGLDPCRLGPEIASIRPLSLPRVSETSPGVLTGELIYLDRFGNLVTNVPMASLSQVAMLIVGETKIQGPVCRSYAERRFQRAPGDIGQSGKRSRPPRCPPWRPGRGARAAPDRRSK